MRMYKIILSIFVLLTFWGDNLFSQSKNQIAIGPYVQNVTDEKATICWSTITGQSILINPDSSKQIINEYQHHEMMLGDLHPNSTYSYDVLGNGSSEGKGSFRTFPKKFVPFRFVVLGDTRGRHKIHAQHVKRIIEKEPLFVVNTGDLISDGLKIQHWEKFFEINRELMRNVPYFPVLGNHEHDSKHYYDFFNLPGNERYYHFSVGDALFIVLDTSGEDYQTPDYIKDENKEYFWNNYNLIYFKEQKAWLEHTLDLHKDAGFIFVFFHEPLFSVKPSRVEDAKMRRAFWGDIFERHGVQVILNGHDHHYHHAFSGGTHYITTAGGGAGLYDVSAIQPETVMVKKVEHFVVVDVGLNEAKLTAIDINDNVIEEIKVEKRIR
ncbi:metallophosphoesterase [candidate division KSB1 bacterium]|nr:metallophosphoesterase [candidate division KSB1 bacterium]